MQLNVYDMDNTLIDTKDAIRQCQIEGLYRATGNDIANLESLLKEKGIAGALSHLNIDQDIFFKTHYKTFDPFEAAWNGKIKIFDDVQRYFNLREDYEYEPTGKLGTRPFARHAIISNSSISATKNKIEALRMRTDEFDYVFAEVEKDKAKPKSYMAEQLANRLMDCHEICAIRKIINVGDQITDIKFGDVLYDSIATKMRHKPLFDNYLIDRDGLYESMPNVRIIKSFMEIQND